MRKPELVFGVVLAALATVAAGCDDDEVKAPRTGHTGHTSQYPACNDITQACHAVDVGDGPIHDCHDAAHAARSEADCTGIRDSCLATCRAAADGGARDGGATADGG
jgi:hypothetical protein